VVREAIVSAGGVGWASSSDQFRASVVTPKFIEEQPQLPFGVAQGRLSTHHPQAEKRLGPRWLRMTDSCGANIRLGANFGPKTLAHGGLGGELEG